MKRDSKGDEDTFDLIESALSTLILPVVKKSFVLLKFKPLEIVERVLFAVTFVSAPMESANGFAISTIGLLSSESSGKSCHKEELMPLRSESTNTISEQIEKLINKKVIKVYI